MPAAVIRQLHWLAHKEYGQSLTVPHQYYVDGAITVGDICVASDCADAKSGDWRTIAVVGLGKGGRAYFALDITDTADPKILWEFADDDLGFSFGNPIITKRAGRWVVLFGSGYNNVSSGDGKGQLFVLDAKTGAKLSGPMPRFLTRCGCTTIAVIGVRPRVWPSGGAAATERIPTTPEPPSRFVTTTFWPKARAG